MKNVSYLLSMLVAISLLSCGQDKVEEEKNFTTPDLSLFGLHGHVLAVNTTSYENDCNTYLTPFRLTFTEEGSISEYSFKMDEYSQYSFTFDSSGESASCNIDGDKRQYDVARLDDGRLTQIIPNQRWEGRPEGGSLVFKWNTKGRVSNVNLNIEEGRPNMSVEYNEDGLPSQIEKSGYGSESYTFKYKEYDEHGNWIRCSVTYSSAGEYDGEPDVVKDFEMTRKIEYYPNPIE